MSSPTQQPSEHREHDAASAAFERRPDDVDARPPHARVARRRGGVGETGAAAIAARIRRLVAQHDGGDVCAAAKRLGVPVQHVIRIERLLADEGEGDTPGGAAESLLTAVVLRYHVDATWLLTGSEQPAAGDLPPAVRLWLADLLLAIGTRVFDEYRAGRANGGALARQQRGDRAAGPERPPPNVS